MRTVARTPAHVHLLYVSLALLTAVAGLAIGVFAGSARAGAGSEEPPVLKLDPIVQIHFPAGAAVTLDGREVPGASPVTTTLAAGRPALVRVSGAGITPAESQLTLDYNQMRVLDFVAVDLKKKDP